MNATNKAAYRRFLILILLSYISLEASGQKPAYNIFRQDGRKATYQKMEKAASDADVVLFGELHNDPIAHWMQLELTVSLHENRGAQLTLGAEMFESDNQLIIDEYISGLISETKFEEEARLWKNYKTDYKPLLEFAKENGLLFVATNIPRRYANSVFKQGVSILDSLSDLARTFIAPLPLVFDTSLHCYKQLKDGREMGGHASSSLVDAQAVKDATMSYFILRNWEPGRLFIHFNGAYHSDNFESINWFLKRERSNLKIVTISTVRQADVSRLEEEAIGKANFIICVPSTMTDTH